MIEYILKLAIRQRLVVLFLVLGAALFGVQSLLKLPIDAVPDITNNQVQINALAPSLSPTEVEKQVTYPIENALAGIAGLESTRSMSRNGFAQVTAVFSDKTNVYFARQQVAERLSEVKGALPTGIEPSLGPISTGLGEVYMWLVRLNPQRTASAEGEAGWQPNGSYRTPEGRFSIPTANAPPISARCRIGLCGHNYEMLLASPASIPSAAMSKNFTSNRVLIG